MGGHVIVFYPRDSVKWVISGGKGKSGDGKRSWKLPSDEIENEKKESIGSRMYIYIYIRGRKFQLLHLVLVEFSSRFSRIILKYKWSRS